MKISTKSRYAVRALVDMASRERGKPVKRKNIAQAQEISDSYLENILISLKASHLIEVERGAHGGYRLARKPSRITLLDVITAMEGPLVLVNCRKGGKECSRTSQCQAQFYWRNLEDVMKEYLSGVTISKIREGQSNQALTYSI